MNKAEYEAELAVMRELAGRCPCGWQLPISVFSYQVGTKIGPEGQGHLENTYVELVCPLCGCAHRFFTARADMPGSTGSDA